MIRSEIIARGRVQKVRYRDIVHEIAADLGLRGKIENLKDRTKVRIIVEGEKEVIDDFIERIKIKDGFREVKEVETIHEEEIAEFTFEDFKIEYGDPTTEQRESLDAGLIFLEKIGDKVDLVAEKVDVVGEKVDRVGDKVDESKKEIVSAVNASKNAVVHTINERFDQLDAKYGEIHETMANILGEIREDRKTLIDILSEIRIDREEAWKLRTKEIERIIKEFRESIERLIDKIERRD